MPSNESVKVQAYRKRYAEEHREDKRARDKIYRESPHGRTIQQKYCEEHKEQILKMKRDWHNKRRFEAIDYYSNGTFACAKCGYSDIRALTIDHINGGGSQHLKFIHRRIAPWLKRNNYPEGFQILCMNCQFIKKIENKEL